MNVNFGAGGFNVSHNMSANVLRVGDRIHLKPLTLISMFVQSSVETQ